MTEADVDPRLLTALANAAPDALLVVDARGRIEFANRATLQMFGYPPGKLLGLAIESLVPTRYRVRHRVDRSRFVADPHSRPMGLNMELVGLRRDGSEFPVEVSLSPMALSGERRVVAAVRDVTELKRSRELLRRSQRQMALARLAEQAVSTTGIEWFCRNAMGVLVQQLKLSHAGICERSHEGKHVRFVGVHGWSEAAARRPPGRRRDRVAWPIQSARIADRVPSRRRTAQRRREPVRTEHRASGGGRIRAAAPPGHAAAGIQDGGARSADWRRRARFQQSADRDRRQPADPRRRAGGSAGCASAGRLGQPRGTPRRGIDRQAAGLLAQAAAERPGRRLRAAAGRNARSAAAHARRGHRPALSHRFGSAACA